METRFSAAFAALIVLFSALAPPARAADPLPGPYAAEVLRILDGDTFEARIRVWLGFDVVRLVRIAGVDAPEMRSSCEEGRNAALAARARLAALLSGGAVALTDIRFGKYARRIVAAVRLPSGADVGETLISTGHAQPARRGRIDRCP